MIFVLVQADYPAPPLSLSLMSYSGSEDTGSVPESCHRAVRMRSLFQIHKLII
jgi:hypothetical protein